MPSFDKPQRYFFETDDGSFLSTDTEGFVYRDITAAQRAALDALGDMAKEAINGASGRVFSITVKLADGEIVFRTSLLFHRVPDEQQKPI